MDQAPLLDAWKAARRADRRSMQIPGHKMRYGRTDRDAFAADLLADLIADTLAAKISHWQDTSVWFCGPMPFGTTLQKQLQQHGMLETQFHQECFQLR